MMTFPQVLIDGELLGGFTEVQAAVETGAWTSCCRLSRIRPVSLLAPRRAA